MVIVSINALSFGSTGNIMMQVSDLARKSGYEAYTFSKPVPNREISEKWRQYHHYINTIRGVSLTARLSVYSGLDGVFAYNSTKKLLVQLEKIKPDVIHLHNLHGWFLNLEMLFSYIKRKRIRVIWTLHDCWSFTGHCTYYSLVGCEKWESGCSHCPQFKEYPQAKIDRSKKMWHLKKEWFTGVENLTIVTPSQWLAEQVKHSFLQDYPVRVIHNGIDLTVFKPVFSDFRQKLHIRDDQILLLGVAAEWGKRKGIDVFVELAKRLDQQKYRIVLVGTDESVDLLLPKGIISLHSTNNQTELAEIYTAADLFVNPTREEVFGLVNIEALACGTPGITFRSGGSPECYNDKCGKVVDTIDEMLQFIKNYSKSSSFNRENCIIHAMKFDKKSTFQEYIDLYGE